MPQAPVPNPTPPDVPALLARLAGVAVALGTLWAVVVKRGTACARWLVNAGHDGDTFDARVLDTLERDSKAAHSKLRGAVLTANRVDIERREMDIEAAVVAAAATDRKVDEVLRVVGVQAEQMRPLQQLPAAVTEMTAALRANGVRGDAQNDVLRELRDELRAQRGTLAQHGEDNASFRATAAEQLTGLRERLDEAHDRLDAWDGVERRTSGRDTRRDAATDRRTGGRRAKDAHDGHDPHRS